MEETEQDEFRRLRSQTKGIATGLRRLDTNLRASISRFGPTPEAIQMRGEIRKMLEDLTAAWTGGRK